MAALGSAHDTAHGGSRDRETAQDILHEVLDPQPKPSAVQVQYPNNSTCVDDDASMRTEAAARGHPEISGCIDVGGMCTNVDGLGTTARKLCCSTCTAPGAPTQNLPSPSTGPVDIYFLAGQSGCQGLSSVSKLKASGRYSSLHHAQPKVWFAGYHGVQAPEMFTIIPMSPVVNNLNTFGPEVSLGERLHSLTGRSIVLMKYCWGGSSAQFDWNPSTPENGWNRQADNGTAAWLIDPAHGGANLGKRRRAYKNFVYTYRRTTEALQAAGVVHENKAIVWIQGQADSGRHWNEFGLDETRLLDALRCDVGYFRLPIISQGSDYISHLRSGKAFAEAAVEGCNLVVLETALASQKAPTPGQKVCNPSDGDACLDSMYVNFDMFEFYGYDPKFPAELKPEGATGKEFAWFVDMEHNLHAEYDSQVHRARLNPSLTNPLPHPRALQRRSCSGATSPTLSSRASHRRDFPTLIEIMTQR